MRKSPEPTDMILAKDYSHEPLFTIFCKHDTDRDGYLMKGEVTGALKEADIPVQNEDLAFEWLDRNFENRINYKQFRVVCEKARRICPDCRYENIESEVSDCEQEELLRTYWRRFDPERNGWCYADAVIDYLAADWGITVDPV